MTEFIGLIEFARHQLSDPFIEKLHPIAQHLGLLNFNISRGISLQAKAGTESDLVERRGWE